jgi:hypothetical protein
MQLQANMGAWNLLGFVIETDYFEAHDNNHKRASKKN